MKRFTKTLFATGLLALAAHSYAATNNNVSVSPAERAKIESVVHDYLIQKPEVLVEALQVLQRKQYEHAEQTVKQTQQHAAQYATPLFRQSNDPAAGNPNGKVTIVEFFDYQCPHCVDMAPVIDAIVKANPDVRIIFKEFPIRGPMSDFASRAALAANKQGKYVEFSHGLLTANQPLTQEVVFKIAKDSGVDVDQLKKDMADKHIDDQLKSNLKLAKDLKLFGTPAFFIGKTDAKNNITYVPGQMDQNQMQGMIDKTK
jgi:protein-disulfide isomerase